MRLVTYAEAGAARLGAVLGSEVVDLERASQLAPPDNAPSLPSDCRAFLEMGATAWAIAATAVAEALKIPAPEAHLCGLRRPLDPATLLPVVPNPSKIICVGRNYADHVTEIGASRPARPVTFIRFAQTLVGCAAPVWLPRVSNQLDWEGELAVIIGRRARYVPVEQAYAVVAGYSVFNDLSVRDFQLRTPQYTPGKNFDATAPFGPALVSIDEVPDPHDLEIEVTVNDETVQHANTGEMIFSIAEIIADISEWTTLQPGDVIATGTPAGVGGTRTPPRFLVAGDVVRVRIETVGELNNVVVDEPAADWFERG